MKITNELKEYLENHKNIQEVHFNSKGEYLFMHKPTHLVAMTREQVLNAQTADTEATVEAAVIAEVQTVNNGASEVEVKVNA